MPRELVLVLGGARAGKSAFAQRLARYGGRVLFVATAEAGDEEMAGRIARHKARRPAGWDTVEEPLAVAEALADRADRYDTVLLDCLTLWVSNLMLRQPGPVTTGQAIATQVQRLLDSYQAGRATWIVVSNEVGLGVVPAAETGRAYRDLLGKANQAFARQADRVYLLVAGLAMELKSLGARPLEGGDG